MLAYLKSRSLELSSHTGVLISGITAAAIKANGMLAPWDYLIFAAAFGAIMLPEKWKAGS